MDRRYFIFIFSTGAALFGAPPLHAERGGQAPWNSSKAPSEAGAVLVQLSRRNARGPVLVLLEANRWRIANIVHDNGRGLLDHHREITARELEAA